MNYYKRCSIIALVGTFTVLTGCTSTTTTASNATANNAVVEDTKTANKNSTTMEVVDTTDWQTYTNEEYGFSFKYPKEWGEVMVDKNDPDQFTQGTKTTLEFSKDSSIAIQGRSTAIIDIETVDYQLNAPTDGANIPINKIDFTHSNDALASELKRPETIDLAVKKITVSNVQGLFLKETAMDLSEEEYIVIYYMFPKYNSDHSINFTIYADASTASVLEKVVNTIVFDES